jgi:hypothetical protein
MGHLADAPALPIDTGYAQEERGITDTGLYEEKKLAKRSYLGTHPCVKGIIADWAD